MTPSRATTEPHDKSNALPVGTASHSTPGYTVAHFNAKDVPAGTDLYAHVVSEASLVHDLVRELGVAEGRLMTLDAMNHPAIPSNADVISRIRRVLTTAEGVATVVKPPLRRPENFEFAMDFLGDPEASALREYIEQLERAAGVETTNA